MFGPRRTRFPSFTKDPIGRIYPFLHLFQLFILVTLARSSDAPVNGTSRTSSVARTTARTIASSIPQIRSESNSGNAGTSGNGTLVYSESNIGNTSSKSTGNKNALNASRTRDSTNSSDLEFVELRGKNSSVNMKSICLQGIEYTENSLPCIPLCCEQGERLEKNKCRHISEDEAKKAKYKFPDIYDDDLNLINRKVDKDNFEFFVWDPCNGDGRYKLMPEESTDDIFMLLENGSIYLPEGMIIIDHTSYCLGITDTDLYDVVLCYGNFNATEMFVEYPVGLLISAPFLFATFLVYTIIPELRNMHGLTLRGYVGSLFVAYTFLATLQLLPQEKFSDFSCIFIGTIFFVTRKIK